MLLKYCLWKLLPSVFLRMSSAGGTQFSIGMYSGRSPFDLQPAPGAANPVLSVPDITSVPVGTVADPFMLRVDDVWHLFFEITNKLTNKGEIALATSDDALRWTFRRIVLTEPFHLSYPYVFCWDGDFFMIPETARSRSVRLYRADRFPFRWSHVSTLLSGRRFADSSILRYDDLWWLFTDAGKDSKSPELRLYFAEELSGPWTEHPGSPLAGGDPHVSRPGGRVILVDGSPCRFSQNVYPVYGTDVRAFEIVELTRTGYSERQVRDRPVLGPGGDTWNRDGMHHVDAHQLGDDSWLACVDGCIRHGFGDDDGARPAARRSQDI